MANLYTYTTSRLPIVRILVSIFDITTETQTTGQDKEGLRKFHVTLRRYKLRYQGVDISSSTRVVNVTFSSLQSIESTAIVRRQRYVLPQTSG